MSRLLANLKQEAFKPKPFVELLFNHKMPKMTIVPCRTRYMHNRHRDPKYRKERARKIWKVELPDFDHMRKDDDRLSPDQIRSKLKEKGVAPPNPWNERELYYPCTIAVIDPYKPPDGDGKSSAIDFLTSPLSKGKDLVANRRALSNIRTFEGDDFELDNFEKQTTDIYVKAHEALASKDEEKVFDYVTEHCFPLMSAGVNRHTIHWKYLGDVEPPRVVQVRVGDLVAKGNKYAQITVRMYTKQILAIYDRHGRLVHGSPSDVKEVLEFVVFEKYLANEYGSWRLHERIRHEEPTGTFSSRVSKTFVLNSAS